MKTVFVIFELINKEQDFIGVASTFEKAKEVIREYETTCRCGDILPVVIYEFEIDSIRVIHSWDRVGEKDECGRLIKDEPFKQII